MDAFSKRLRERARDLELSDAEVARRAGLTERRYSHYVNGSREPDLATLVKICQVLGTTPNYLLGFAETKRGRAADKLRERLLIAAEALDAATLRTAMVQVEALVKQGRR